MVCMPLFIVVHTNPCTCTQTSLSHPLANLQLPQEDMDNVDRKIRSRPDFAPFVLVFCCFLFFQLPGEQQREVKR